MCNWGYDHDSENKQAKKLKEIKSCPLLLELTSC